MPGFAQYCVTSPSAAAGKHQAGAHARVPVKPPGQAVLCDAPQVARFALDSFASKAGASSKLRPQPLHQASPWLVEPNRNAWGVRCAVVPGQWQPRLSGRCLRTDFVLVVQRQTRIGTDQGVLQAAIDVHPSALGARSRRS